MSSDKMKRTGSLSLQDVDQMRGKGQPGFLTNPSSKTDAFIDWYSGVYDKPFEELSDDDLTQFCRQGWEPEYTVPIALSRLEHNPFIGQYYDGDLIIALGHICPQFWEEDPDLRAEFYGLLSRTISLLQANEGSKEIIENFPAVYVDDDTRTEIIDIWKRGQSI